MNWDLNGQSADIEQALAGGAPQRVGWFRFYFNDQRWEWSEQVQRMHGYEPGTVTPTTELVLAHKHPEDAVRSPPPSTTSSTPTSRSAPAIGSSIPAEICITSSWPVTGSTTAGVQ
jgi:hypothetical protein